MRNRRKVLRLAAGIVIGFVATSLLVGCQVVAAPCTLNWVGPAGGQFTAAVNWSPAVAPGPADRVCAPDGSKIVVSGGATVDSADLRGTLTVGAGATLAINSLNNISSLGRLTLSGTLAGDGLVIARSLDLTGGTIGGQMGMLAVTGVDPSTITAGTITDAKRLTIGNNFAWTGTLGVCDRAAFAIAGTLNQTTPVTVTTAGCVAATSPSFGVIAGGVFNQSANINSATVPVTNEGTWTINTGATLTANTFNTGTGPGVLTGRGTLTGTVTGAGTIHPGSGNAGSLTINGALAGSAIHLQHSIASAAAGTGYNQVTVNGSVNLAGVIVEAWLTGGYVPPTGTALSLVNTTTPTGQLKVLNASGIAPRGWKQVNTPAAINIEVTVCLPRPTGTAVSGCQTAYDFDGDGKADFVWLHTPSTTWYRAVVGPPPATNTFAFTPNAWWNVTGDFAGNGVTDLVTGRSTGSWTVSGAAGSVVAPDLPGLPGPGLDMIPLAADFDGDHKADAAWFDDRSATWYIANLPPIQFGNLTTGRSDYDYPVPADYDGDGKADLATYNPRTALWSIKRSSDGVIQTFTLGDPRRITIPVPADYDGVGRAQAAVFDATGWLIQGHPSRDPFGSSGTLGNVLYDAFPVAADYDGDGKADLSYVTNLDQNYPRDWYVKGLGKVATLTPTSGSSGSTMPAPLSMSIFTQISRWTLVARCVNNPTLC